MTEPVVIQPLTMRSIGDCAICCLSMICGRTYADVVKTIPRRWRSSCHAEGLSIRQICSVAKRLGTRLEYWESPDDDNERGWERDDSIGVVDLERAIEPCDGHLVIYLKGIVFNPADGEIWTDLDAFCERGKWKVEGFLWRTK